MHILGTEKRKTKNWRYDVWNRLKKNKLKVDGVLLRTQGHKRQPFRILSVVLIVHSPYVWAQQHLLVEVGLVLKFEQSSDNGTIDHSIIIEPTCSFLVWPTLSSVTQHGMKPSRTRIKFKQLCPKNQQNSSKVANIKLWISSTHIIYAVR